MRINTIFFKFNNKEYFMDFLKNLWKNQLDAVMGVGAAFHYIPTFAER